MRGDVDVTHCDLRVRHWGRASRPPGRSRLTILRTGSISGSPHDPRAPRDSCVESEFLLSFCSAAWPRDDSLCATCPTRANNLALCFFGRDQFLGRHTIPVIPAWNPIFTFVFARRCGPGMTPGVPPPSKMESKNCIPRRNHGHCWPGGGWGG